MKTLIHISKQIAAAVLALGLATPALADTTFTPSATIQGEATDNAGQRGPNQGARGDAITTLQAGGELLYSRPTFAWKFSALGEYERYLSAGVKNTWAAGGLDGKWRPDERTSVRSTSKASYAPDRYDPRVPYRLVAATPAGADLPLFVRATTMKGSEQIQADRWITEIVRGRAIGEFSALHFSDRRAVGPQSGAIPARVLQSRDAGRLELDGLRQLTEPWAVGLYGSGSRADYEAGPSVYTEELGGITEWNVSERMIFAAKLGGQYVQVPGPRGQPAHLGYSGEVSLKRFWERGQLELAAKDGVSVTTSSIPAAEEQTGRIAGTFLPWQMVEAGAYAAATREHSMYQVYRATGTATILSACTTLGWRFKEHWTAKLGFDHTRQTATGLVEIPYQANTVYLGITFAGLSFGDPPANP